MSRTGVIIAVIIMLALAAAAWFVLPRNQSPASGATIARTQPLLDFKPSDVAEFMVEHADGKRDIVFKTADGWRLRASQSDNMDAPSWPIAGAQMRGMLTILHNLVPVAQAPDESLGVDAVTLRIRLTDTTEHMLRFDARSIGGRRLVQAGDGAPVYIDKPVYEALTNPGPMGWRQSNLLRGIGVEVSRLTIESVQGKLKLARVRGIWRLREPVRAAADESAVDQLLTALAALSALRWVDNASERADIDIEDFPQALRFTIERDRRIVDSDGSSTITTDIQHLTIGGKPNAAGDERYALLGSDGIAATVSAKLLLAIEVDPAVYASRTAIVVDRSQIGSIKITPPGNSVATVTRTLDGWKLEHPPNGGRIVPDEHVRALLDLLMRRYADDVSLEETTSAANTSSTSLVIQVFGFNHEALGEVRLAPVETGLTLFSDGLVHRYLDMELPEMLSALMK